MTPFGPGVWAYALGLSTNPTVTQRITEWQPTSLRDVPGMLFFGSALAVVVLIARRGRATSWPTLAWLGAFFVIGAYAIRGVAWWPLGAVAAIAGVLVTSRVADPAQPVALGTAADAAAERRRRRRSSSLVGVALLPLWRPLDPGLRAPAGVVGMAPPGITAALRELGRPGDPSSTRNHGAPGSSSSCRDLPVAVDSRIEMFPASRLGRLRGVAAGVDGWQAQLDDWDVSIIVVGGQGPGVLRSADGRRLADGPRRRGRLGSGGPRRRSAGPLAAAETSRPSCRRASG